MNKNIEIIQPDDWHVHFREGDMLEMVTNFSSRINNRCVAMPNTEIPITDTNKASAYKELLNKAKKGLDRRDIKNSNKNESIFLDPLFEILNKGESQAEIWKKMYYDVWGKNVDFIYKENYFGK